ncbi:hypothetical protein OSB04_006140 [Centaurea solstitialis]|uniref:Integrase catalytic domain-containing protein n=1 Tax=Centaurea solstitialis TaxID=347529 RepID=A0AA38TU20_9ASTR|nr:hypothetical protein OSB04_006140 [Centaurea solstitialis]
MTDDRPMWDKRSEVRFTPRSAINKTDGKMVEINKGLIKMINTISFDGEPRGNPYQHLEAFEDICELVTTKDDEVKLRVFPFTLTNKAKDWFKQLLPGSITTWDDLKSAFLSRYFPISKANKIRAEIRNFKQGKDSLVKAWGRYKSLFLVFPNHGIDDREMIDVFYAGLTNDSRLRLDSSCGGIFSYKTVKEARKLLDDMEAHYLDWSTDEEQEETQPAHLDVVSSSDEHIHATKDFTETPNPLSKPYGGVIEQLFHHFSQEQGKMGADVEQKMQGFVNFIAGLYRGVDQFLRDVKETFPHMEAEAQAEVFTTTRGGKVVVGPPMPQTNQIPNMQVVELEVELPSRPTKEVREEAVRPRESTTPHVPTRVPYPARLRKRKERGPISFLKELVANKARMGTEEIAFLNAECSAMLSDTLKKGDPGSFIIPCYFGKSVSCRALADLGASINLMPLSFYQKLGLNDLKSTRMTIQLADRSIKYPVGIAEDVIVRVDRIEFPADFVILDIKDEVKVPLILGRPFLNTASAIIHVAERELSLGIGEDRITLSIDGIPDYNDSINALDSIDDFTESEPNDYLFESGEWEESLAIEKRWDEAVGEEEEDFEELKQEDNVRVKNSVEEPPDLELKDLPEHLEYQFLEGNNSLPVIISSLLTDNEKDRLIEVLKKHKKALAWKISDIPGISPSFCTHKILMEDNFKPCVQKQRRLNPKMQEVVKKEVIKLLDTGIIYPISDSPWVSPVQVVPKKGGLTVVTNDNNELVPTRTFTGWRVCIDYRKLNDATRKDHFPLPFIDQMLERLAGNEYYCFLDGFSGYFQIPIDPEDQKKTTFTCPFGTFAYRRMPFGLCNEPATFQRCMTAIFQDMIENCMEVFMDDFSVFGNSFDDCLSSLDRVLARCEESHLVLNWEKCHFMVREGIVLGHKISKDGLEVDKAKIDTISKLPPPTNIKGVRSFLGHAGFYRRFIQDFSKISRPLTKLLEKDAPFISDEKCISAFETLKRHLTNAPIMVPPDWDQPFEIMCDASDYAVGAVLGQREDPIPWYANFANYLAAGVLVKGPDRIHRRCVSGPAAWDILTNYHKGPTGGHFGANLTARKGRQHHKEDEMPQQSISVSEVFDVWGIDFMGPFHDSGGNKYILVVVDYVSKWAEAKASPTNDAKVIVDFVKSLVCRYGCPKAIISDRGTHFANYLLEKTLKRYGVHHRFSTAYHPQANGQAENTNRALKRILEKTVDNNPKIWSQKLEDALWAYRTAYKTPIGSTPYRMLYGKACHLPFEFEYKALWALKKVHMDDTESGRERLISLHELEELRSLAYENSKIYKEQRKKWHDAHLKEVKVFKEGDKVLMYQTRFKFSPGKLKSRWIGPYVVLKAYPSGYVDLMTERGSFKVNGHRLKLYNENDPVRNGERASSSHNVQDHPCLSFDSDNILRSEKMSLMIELDRLKKREVEIGSIVDLQFVEKIGFGDRLSSLLMREYRDQFGVLRFVSNDWEKALKTHEPIYYELVLEFLATFSFDVEAYDEDRLEGPCIRFRLLGEWYGITLPRFGVLLGFFTAAQSRSGYFSHYFLTGPCEPSAEFVGAEFLATIGSGPYLQSNTKESSITLPEHRLLHWMLVHSFAYRKAIKEKVPEGDLWLLSRLVNRNAITNLSYVMAKMFQNAGKIHDKAGTGLCGGHFITVIAEKLGTLTPEVCGTLTKLSPMGFLDKALFHSMKLLAPGPRGVLLCGLGISPPMKSRTIGEHHEMMERLDRVSYDVYGVRRELSWVAASMGEYFESVGHAPTAPLQPHPVWRDSDDGPADQNRFRHITREVSLFPNYSLIVLIVALRTLHILSVGRGLCRLEGPCIRFRLLGEWYGITLLRFGVLLGFFTAPQSRSGYFSYYFLTGACEPSAEFVGADFWATIGSGPYLQFNTKESSITLPEHRLLHRMLVHSFAYRRAIKEKVPEGDLWLLSRLVNRNAITNLSYVMAKMFQNAGKVHDKAGTGLCGGHFITVIAEKLGTLTPDVRGTLTKLSPMGFLDKVLFRSMKLLAPGPRRGTFVWIGDVTPNEEPVGMATSPPQPTFPGQSSNPPPANQQGSGSLQEAIQGLSEHMGVEHHEMMERLDRVSYDMYGVRRELSWVAASMSEYFESVGHAPSAPLQPHPVWRDSDDGPAGYSTYDEWAFENCN